MAKYVKLVFDKSPETQICCYTTLRSQPQIVDVATQELKQYFLKSSEGGQVNVALRWSLNNHGLEVPQRKKDAVDHIGNARLLRLLFKNLARCCPELGAVRREIKGLCWQCDSTL